MKLSVIIPCYNEEGNVIPMYNKLCEVLGKEKFELIFVDDGSADKTLEMLKILYDNDKKRVRVVTFSRNFGKDAAMYAGLSKAVGEYTCIIDADLQQSPEYLVKMLNYLEENKEYDQVAMIINSRNKNILMKLFSIMFYKLIDAISDIKFVSGASDFRMFRSNVKDAIVSLGENNRFSKGIFAWIGFNTKYMTYEVKNRFSGKTKFNFRSSFKYGIEGILGFTTKPLRIATYIGLISSFTAFITILVIIIRTAIYGIDVPGFASLMCVILLIGGIQLITIGILGEYLAKNYLETKKRPIYISKEEIGFKGEK